MISQTHLRTVRVFQRMYTNIESLTNLAVLIINIELCKACTYKNEYDSQTGVAEAVKLSKMGFGQAEQPGRLFILGFLQVTAKVFLAQIS